MERLIVCARCHRHVKLGDTCPFCRARAAVGLAGAVAVGLGMSLAAACGSTVVGPGGASASTTIGGDVGGAGGTTSSGTTSSDTGYGGVLPPYGPPPPWKDAEP